jgi:HEAT repeats
MAPNDLPSRPSVEQLRKRAKELLKAARNQDPAAGARLQHRLSERTTRLQLADALTVIAREHGFPSWTKLKAYVDSLSVANANVVQMASLPPRIAGPSRPRGPRQMPGRRDIQELHAAVVQAARETGEPFPFLFAPPLGPLRKAVQLPLREALVASGDHALVVNVLLRGADHRNPRIRAECAHAMDWLADERCLSVLLRLADDPVARVRWFALHSLACDECKLEPLPSCSDVLPLLVSKARDDPSERVRRRASETLRLMAGSQRVGLGSG